MPAIRDILADDDFYTNTDYPFEVEAVDDAGVAVPITGWSLSWMLKKRSTDADASAIITKTTAAGGITITDGPNGICQVNVAAADTDGTVKPGSYVHELKRIDAGNERVIVNGLAVLKRSAHIT